MQKIPLTQGQFALVDDRDYCYLSQWKWSATWSKDSNSYYAQRSTYKNKKKNTVLMHRSILLANKGEVVDHENHNTLDNQRSNIRITRENNKNALKRKDNKTGFTGVDFHLRYNNFRVRISVKNKSVFIGNFKNLDDAIKARKEANIKYGYHENHGKIKS